jgi:hypothetical protein
MIESVVAGLARLWPVLNFTLAGFQLLCPDLPPIGGVWAGAVISWRWLQQFYPQRSYLGRPALSPKKALHSAGLLCAKGYAISLSHQRPRRGSGPPLTT